MYQTIIALLVLLNVNTTQIVNSYSVNATVKPAETESNIPFTEAKRYFINNNVAEGQLKNPKITTQAEFDKYFGMATVMGENGQPTIIDFSKQYVIAALGKTSDKAPSMAVKSLTQQGKKIVFTYSYNEGEKQTYTARPVLILVVDNAYQGKVVLKQETAKK